MTATAAQTRPQRPWWLTLILGIAAIIVGGLLLWGNLVTQVQDLLPVGGSAGHLVAGGWHLRHRVPVCRSHRVGLEVVHRHCQHHRRWLHPDVSDPGRAGTAAALRADPGHLGRGEGHASCSSSPSRAAAGPRASWASSRSSLAVSSSPTTACRAGAGAGLGRERCSPSSAAFSWSIRLSSSARRRPVSDAR